MADHDEIQYDVIIIGGGVAGLTAGVHVAARGLRPLVLEADPDYAGGRMAGGDTVAFEHGGQTWRFRGEHGVHGLWAPYHNLRAMLARNGIAPDYVAAKEETWIYGHHGRVSRAEVGSALRRSWVPAPLHYLALFARPRFLGMLSLADWLSLPLVLASLLFAVGVDPLGEDQPLEDMWLDDLVKYWGPGVRSFMVGLARNGLSARPQEIPLSGFAAFLRFYSVLRRDAWAFDYLPSDGGSSLVDPLAARLRALGGELALGRRVTRLARDGDGWRVTWPGGAAAAKQVILACDAPGAKALVAASPALDEPAGGLYWPGGQATAVVRIWYDAAPRPGAEAGIFSGDFIIDNYFWLQRISWPYFEFHRETGGSAVEVHIYGPPELLEEADAGLLARAIADVGRGYPELRGHRIHQTITRNPATHTLFGVGPADKHLGTQTPWENLYCCGDWVRHESPALFLERACVTGMAAANAVLASRGKETWEILAVKKPEAFAGFVQWLMQRGRRARRRRRRSRDIEQG